MIRASLPLAELVASGFQLSSEEAVAIVLEVCDQVARGAGTQLAVGELPLEQVIRLETGGEVSAWGIGITERTVTELGRLLEQLLPGPGAPAAVRAPGALRLIAARAARDLDLPPFVSVSEFAAALRRFAKHDRRALVAAVVERWQATTRRESAADEVGGHVAIARDEIRGRGDRSEPGEPGEAGPAPLHAAPVDPAFDLPLNERKPAAVRTDIEYSAIAASPRPARFVERRRSGRPDVLRRLLREADEDRFAPPAAARREPVAERDPEVERRHTVRSDTLRRLLRDADEELYALREPQRAASLRLHAAVVAASRRQPVAPPQGRPAGRRLGRRLAYTAAAAVVIALSGLAGYYHPLRGYSEGFGSPVASAHEGRAPATTSPVSALPHAWDLLSRAVSGHHAAAPSSAPGPRPPAATDRENGRGRASPIAEGSSGADRPVADEAEHPEQQSAVFLPPSTGRDGNSVPADTTVSPDGRSGGDLQVMTVTDRGATAANARMSPDRRFVAFDSDRDGERGVYVASSDGSGVRRVSGEGFAARPAWSSDGTRLAFLRAEVDRPDVFNLWLCDVASGRLTRLTAYQAGRVSSASWFPDGRHIFYSRDDQLFALDIDNRETLPYPSPRRGRRADDVAVSPDGRRVVFRVDGDGAWLLDLGDGRARRLVDDPTIEGLAWTPDGRGIAYRAARSGDWSQMVMAPPSAAPSTNR